MGIKRIVDTSFWTDGKVDEFKTVFCESLCEVRKCARSRNVATCGDCSEWRSCPTVGAIIANAPSALQNLER